MLKLSMADEQHTQHRPGPGKVALNQLSCVMKAGSLTSLCLSGRDLICKDLAGWSEAKQKLVKPPKAQLVVSMQLVSPLRPLTKGHFFQPVPCHSHLVSLAKVGYIDESRG